MPRSSAGVQRFPGDAASRRVLSINRTPRARSSAAQTEVSTRRFRYPLAMLLELLTGARSARCDRQSVFEGESQWSPAPDSSCSCFVQTHRAFGDLMSWSPPQVPLLLCSHSPDVFQFHSFHRVIQDASAGPYTGGRRRNSGSTTTFGRVWTPLRSPFGRSRATVWENAARLASAVVPRRTRAPSSNAWPASCRRCRPALAASSTDSIVSEKCRDGFALLQLELSRSPWLPERTWGHLRSVLALAFAAPQEGLMSRR